ncbi:MAG: alanine--glyoxylate aminotransferase family protein [Planctomycetota bacterium]|jgi:aspartate aminotransferase-like enzyme
MPSQANPDPDGLLEYSVVYTDRALNHMSSSFQRVMLDISDALKQVYHAESVAIVPGSGTFAMEAVARQFATDQACLIIRNGWFSFRWTQIIERGAITATAAVMKARPVSAAASAPFAPPPIEDVVRKIEAERPAVVFAPHVETSSGMILPPAYLRSIGDAVRAVDGLFVLDCIASGAIWVDMEASGVDVLISAPQKSWSSSPCCGLVMLGPRARARLAETTSSSFSCDLRKWHDIMGAYERGGHAYHATMPTDGLRTFRDALHESLAVGLAPLQERQEELGSKVRGLLTGHGFGSVAAEGFQAPGVVVSYTDDPEIKSGKKFAGLGVQIAAGVPLACDEPTGFSTFRMGLFGLDKLENVDRTVGTLAEVLSKMQ